MAPVPPALTLCLVTRVLVSTEKLAHCKLNVAEVTQSEIGQKQKLQTVLEAMQDLLRPHGWPLRWNVDCEWPLPGGCHCGRCVPGGLVVKNQCILLTYSTRAQVAEERSGKAGVGSTQLRVQTHTSAQCSPPTPTFRGTALRVVCFVWV